MLSGEKKIVQLLSLEHVGCRRDIQIHQSVTPAKYFEINYRPTKKNIERGIKLKKAV